MSRRIGRIAVSDLVVWATNCAVDAVNASAASSAAVAQSAFACSVSFHAASTCAFVSLAVLALSALLADTAVRPAWCRAVARAGRLRARRLGRGGAARLRPHARHPGGGGRCYNAPVRYFAQVKEIPLIYMNLCLCL